MNTLEMPKAERYTISDERLREIEELFRRKRIEAGYRIQQDAAEALHISQDVLSRLEHAFTPFMRVGDVGWVMYRYGIVPNDLFALMGMFDAPIYSIEEREYVRREILPILAQLSPKSLELLKSIAETFLGDQKRVYVRMDAEKLRRGDTILWRGVERRVDGSEVIAEDRVRVFLVPRTSGEAETLVVDRGTELDLLQK